jgi:hypothetical protein
MHRYADNTFLRVLVASSVLIFVLVLKIVNSRRATTRIDLASFERIQGEMTEGEIQLILGCPRGGMVSRTVVRSEFDRFKPRCFQTLEQQTKMVVFAKVGQVQIS